MHRYCTVSVRAVALHAFVYVTIHFAALLGIDDL